VRKYFIQQLARAAPRIIGKRAAVSPTGRFVDLCSAVLPACGLSAKGVAKAIPEIVKQLRAGQGKLVNAKRAA
jgi:hypothetical protein